MGLADIAAKAGARPAPPRVRLRPTTRSDLEFVLTLERDPENLPFITPWERTQHEAAIRFPDFRHFVIEGGAGLDAAGFVILIGCRSPHHSLELKRMVVQQKGRGLGRAALRVLKRIAFDDLAAHRLWLDVKTGNSRAQGFYLSEGFQLDGTLREAFLAPGGYESLLVLSMLVNEFRARRQRSLELVS